MTRRRSRLYRRRRRLPCGHQRRLLHRWLLRMLVCLRLVECILIRMVICRSARLSDTVPCIGASDLRGGMCLLHLGLRSLHGCWLDCWGLWCCLRWRWCLLGLGLKRWVDRDRLYNLVSEINMVASGPRTSLTPLCVLRSRRRGLRQRLRRVFAFNVAHIDSRTSQ